MEIRARLPVLLARRGQQAAPTGQPASLDVRGWSVSLDVWGWSVFLDVWGWSVFLAVRGRSVSLDVWGQVAAPGGRSCGDDRLPVT
ncbi:hypothetical protein Pen02_36460 [Plantactinospora endophytica]|uniref:Uncharacterized protein n=1 Tax=Plantactinospora endophytica TaxID=673535 RepID=A0ABQ4E214_9ACTN|nr:hypothetical protein Pen02_36460 [Plantactinospora endophytica]